MKILIFFVEKEVKPLQESNDLMHPYSINVLGVGM
jgi:hypothetical protein